MSQGYDDVRSAVLAAGSDSRVEVNQRALIDKILARYASAGAVYRELLQNSNDADAKEAEVLITTADSPKGRQVMQVVYRNNGLPFRPQDWSRLRKIAEGNPDVSKVGAFGVGAYTMFSICEEPLVISGEQAMAFSWKGDALWVRVGKSPHPPNEWTSFVLPSRDPYPVPDLVDFGQFLCTSLTFTNSLCDLVVHVDGVKRLSISKRQVGHPRVMTPPRSSSWWSRDGAVTASPTGIFTLGNSDGSITETTMEMSVKIDGESAKVQARYVSAKANVRVSSDMNRRMQRVTKKRPPGEVNIQIFIDADASADLQKKKKGKAGKIAASFSPRLGAGRVFIGFKTSQTTGLGAHVAAPLIPTVEREAIDFQDPVLRVYNTELLFVCGILMRLTLEHSMSLVGTKWSAEEADRKSFEASQKRSDSSESRGREARNDTVAEQPEASQPEQDQSAAGRLFSFAKFMSSGVKKIADVIAAVDITGNDYGDLLKPRDPRPLSAAERDAIVLMRAFSPERSTPDPLVGTVVADGFETCMPGQSPPVLTKTGVARGVESRLPHRGIEGFVDRRVVRRVVLQNAETFLKHVAGCAPLSLPDLIDVLRGKPVEEEDLLRLLKWWSTYYRVDSDASLHSKVVKESISCFVGEPPEDAHAGSKRKVVSLSRIQYSLNGTSFEGNVPMPESVLPKHLRDKIPTQLLDERSFSDWFVPFPFRVWALFISKHPSMTDGRPEDERIRIQILKNLSAEFSRTGTESGTTLRAWLHQTFANVRCIPFDSQIPSQFATDVPRELYLPSAHLEIFDGLSSLKKVSPYVSQAGVSDDFLLAIGVRKTIAMDILFTQLDSLKWNRNPKPLIDYLRSATLTTEDVRKLQTTQYLPETRDQSRTYAPSELYLPSSDVMTLPFLKVLQWPSSHPLVKHSPEVAFLKMLGCQENPPLKGMLQYLTSNVIERSLRIQVLEFISQRLANGGPYENQYAAHEGLKFLPAEIEDPLGSTEPYGELCSPLDCYYEADCACMGFPVLEPFRAGSGRLYGERFRCERRPSAERLVHQLLTIVSQAKEIISMRRNRDGSAQVTESDEDFTQRLLNGFGKIFNYMATRANELDERMVDTLQRAPFIPCADEGGIAWFRPNQICFKSEDQVSDVTAMLFTLVDFNLFLAKVGVKKEPSTAELFRLLLSSPQSVLEKLGSVTKYCSLLRRVAAHPPYNSVTSQMRNTAFLIAFRYDNDVDGEDSSGSGSGEDAEQAETSKYVLAKPGDIFIVDNAFYARMFNVWRAPPESDLESFYKILGSTYISKAVRTRFRYNGQKRTKTPLTNELAERVRERRPLLVSPNVTSRPLERNAAELISDENLNFYEVSKVTAHYTCQNVVKSQEISCCAESHGRRRSTLYITENFDFFDVGSAVGSIILTRCRLEDSFFLGSLLSAPLSQLRAQGFPVDRILRASEPMTVSASPVAAPLPKPSSQELHTQKPHTPSPQGESQKAAISPPTVPQSPHGDEGFENILRQMYPQCSPEHIRRLLGPNPNLESLRKVADTLADGAYPEKTGEELKQQKAAADEGQIAPGKKPGRSGSQLLSRAFRGLRGASAASASASGVTAGPRGLGTPRPAHGTFASGSHHASRPVDDAGNQKGLERLLQDSVRSCRKVSPSGVSSPDDRVISIPESVNADASGCEVIPGQDLKPAPGPFRTGKTSKGIRVFTSRRSQDSAVYVENNWNLVERFAGVISNLCDVYSVRVGTVAIFHEPLGRTIAFNANKALHFNVRYYATLHDNAHRSPSLDCYSFWFTTFAHELAHNLVTAHTKQHGFFTESYVSTYLPKLMEQFSRGGSR